MLCKFLPVKLENFIQSLNSFAHHSPKKNNPFCHYAPTSLYNIISSFFLEHLLLPKRCPEEVFCSKKLKQNKITWLRKKKHSIWRSLLTNLSLKKVNNGKHPSYNKIVYTYTYAYVHRRCKLTNTIKYQFIVNLISFLPT